MTVDVMVVFPTTHLTLKAEKTLEGEHIRHRTVLKPRRISSDCGLAIRLEGRDVDRCRRAVLSARLTPVRFFRQSDGAWECFLRIEDQSE